MMARKSALLLMLLTFLCAAIAITTPWSAGAQVSDDAATTITVGAPDEGIGGEPVSATGVVEGERAEEAPHRLSEEFDRFFDEQINARLIPILFFSISGDLIQVPVYENGEKVISSETGEVEMRTVEVPLIVFMLFGGGIIFTTWYGFINLRGFRHSFDVIRGRFDNPDDTGEISHFRALTSALSGTVGLGNIAAVAIAISTGGPGAMFWMWFAAFFGMSSKFSSCTLSQLYRRRNPDGTVSGGPMWYLDLGLREIGLGYLGKILAVLSAILVMGTSIGGGNMFQSNQAFEALTEGFNVPHWANWIYGLIMMILVGIVILGGIRRIAFVTSRIVPLMCGLYIIAALIIVGRNIDALPETISLIFTRAFTANAVFGGVVGVIVVGVTRAAFSNEAGLGSAAIAHAAAKTEEPVREGMVAMIGPFIDTILVCSMTAFAVIITGAWQEPELQGQGSAITIRAFQSVVEWFPVVLTICILFFAYSTMLAWCYYGERGWIYLFDHLGEEAGLKSVVIFRVIFVLAVFAGAVTKLSAVLTFTDLMLLSMAFPNILGMLFLAPKVKRRVKDYWGRYKSGEMKRVR